MITGGETKLERRKLADWGMGTFLSLALEKYGLHIMSTQYMCFKTLFWHNFIVTITNKYMVTILVLVMILYVT